MSRKRDFTLILIITTFVITCSCALASEIHVTGTGEVLIEADYATIRITIKTLSDKATEATDSTAQKYQSVIRALMKIGLKEDDISTTIFDVGPQHEWEQTNSGRTKKMIGFRALHQIRVRVHDIKIIGEVVDAALEAGAQDIGSLALISSKGDSAYQEALENAVSHAKENANTIAVAGGGHLGRLIELTTHEAAKALGKSQYDKRSEIVVGGVTSIEPSELLIRVTVIGRWEFIQNK